MFSMKKSIKIKPSNVYLFTSRVAANSNYIESISEAKQLFIYANYFMKGYLKIYEYVVTRHGIQMIVKISDAEKLLEITNGEYDETTVCNCISERMRLFLSHYVRKINKLRGRTGVLVHSNFEKESFDSLADARLCMLNLRNQLVKLYQNKLMYRGLKAHYKIPKKLGNGSIFLCSRELRRILKRGKLNTGVQLFGDFKNLVGSNFNFSKEKIFSNPSELKNIKYSP